MLCVKLRTAASRCEMVSGTSLHPCHLALGPSQPPPVVQPAFTCSSCLLLLETTGLPWSSLVPPEHCLYSTWYSGSTEEPFKSDWLRQVCTVKAQLNTNQAATFVELPFILITSLLFRTITCYNFAWVWSFK